MTAGERIDLGDSVATRSRRRTRAPRSMGHRHAQIVIAILAAAVLVSAVVVATLVARPDLSGLLVGSESAAVRDAREGVRRAPEDSDAQMALGFAFQEEGKLDAAVSCYDQALALDKDSLGALYNRGVCLLDLGDAQAAVKDLQRVLTLAPTHALAAYHLGHYYAEQGLFSQVVRVVRPAAQANPDAADLRSLLGQGLERTGQPGAAIVEYQAALERDPSDEVAAAGLERLQKQAPK